MKKILSILTVGCALTLSSCEDWLDKYPLAQMSPETFFSNENELQAFSNTFYTIFPGDGLYNEGYDNIVKNEIAAEMRDGRTIPASGSGWTWTDLRKFNTLLEYSGNCKDTDIRNRYDAVARFFRAYFYFEKVKRFGDVPWYAKPLGSADPELKRPRDSASTTASTATNTTGNGISNRPPTQPRNSSPTAAIRSTPRPDRPPATATCSPRRTRRASRSSSPATIIRRWASSTTPISTPSAPRTANRA